MKSIKDVITEMFMKALRRKDEPIIRLYENFIIKLGYTEEAMKAIAILDSVSTERYVDPIFYAVIYASLNNTEKSLYWLKKAYEIGSPAIGGMGPRLYKTYGGLFESMKSEPAFQDIMARLNFPRK